MNYEEFIKNYHGFSPFADNIGLKLTAMSDGHCEGEVPVTPALFNPIGTIHGGVYYTLADTVGGCAARTRGQIPTTIEDERSDSHNDRRQAQPYPRGYEQR